MLRKRPTNGGSEWSAAREVQEALEKIGITLHDHLVIGRSSHVSFREAGLLPS